MKRVSGNERGIALVGLLLVVGVMIALFFATTITMVSQVQRTRAQIRRQIYSQEIFQNAATIVFDSYMRARGVAACPTGTTSQVIRNIQFCFPNPSPAAATPESGGVPGACIENREANQEVDHLPICLMTSTGEVVFAPINDENSYAAWIIDNVLERNWPKMDLGPSEAQAQSVVQNLFPPIPDPATDVNSQHGPAKGPYGVIYTAANNPSVACKPDAVPETNLGPRSNVAPPFLCVEIRICLRKSTCTANDKYVQRIGFPIQD